MATTPTGIATGLHTPRLDARRKALNAVFSPAAMQKAWKQYVRAGMRGQEVLDLFDYNDFHWNRADLFQHLSQAIVDGRYRPGRSMPARLEKRLGVCRTIVTPSPEDAVVLQCIVEAIFPKAIKAQPSSNAFFSRSHQSPDAEFTFGKDYIWFKQWGRFFRRRMAISSAHEWVVTTDISTFFDNVHYSHLRNILSTFDGMDEVVLDILFAVIDEISWRPDYLPSVGVGLPQVQFDAPRLLAHVYLFEADAYLKGQTNNKFVRWVDDITFAVKSRTEGKRLLRNLDALLQLRGVRLNSAKTQVLSKKAARKFFQGAANEYLDRMKKRIDDKIRKGRSTNALAAQLRRSFDRFVQAEHHGHHDKVCKRYIGLFITLKDPHAISYCLGCFVSDPGMRDTALRYFLALGPLPRLLKSLTQYLKSEDALDDASLCEVARVMTVWRVKPKTAPFRGLGKLGTELAKPVFTSRSDHYLVAAIWLLSKYGTKKQLRETLEATEALWSNSEFLARQVAAAAARFSGSRFRWIAIKIEKHGFRSGVSVLNSLRNLQEHVGSVPNDVRLYILNGKQTSNYSIQRFLIAFRVLSSPKLDQAYKIKLIREARKFVNDPHYDGVLATL